MADKSIRLEFLATDLRSLDREFRRETNAIIRDNTLNAWQQLREATPMGADKGLATSWTVISPRRQSASYDTEYKIVNTDPLAFPKLFGRRAGKMPPPRALERWAGMYVTEFGYNEHWGIKRIAYLIARKIARQGTGRSKQADVLGIRRDLSIVPGSILDEMEQNIAAELEELRLGFY